VGLIWLDHEVSLHCDVSMVSDEYLVRGRGPGKGHLEVVDGMFKCCITYLKASYQVIKRGIHPIRTNRSSVSGMQYVIGQILKQRNEM